MAPFPKQVPPSGRHVEADAAVQHQTDSGEQQPQRAGDVADSGLLQGSRRRRHSPAGSRCAEQRVVGKRLRQVGDEIVDLGAYVGDRHAVPEPRHATVRPDPQALGARRVDARGEAVAVVGAVAEDLQHEQVERALEEVGLSDRHRP